VYATPLTSLTLSLLSLLSLLIPGCGSNPWSAGAHTLAARERKTHRRIERSAVNRAVAGRCIGRDGLERAAGRLHTKLDRFAISYYYDQLVAVAGVAANHVAAFLYIDLAVDAVKFDVCRCGRFYLHLDFEAACAGCLCLSLGSGEYCGCENEGCEGEEIFEAIHGDGKFDCLNVSL